MGRKHELEDTCTVNLGSRTFQLQRKDHFFSELVTCCWTWGCCLHSSWEIYMFPFKVQGCYIPCKKHTGTGILKNLIIAHAAEVHSLRLLSASAYKAHFLFLSEL